jgi:hypothetical protein
MRNEFPKPPSGGLNQKIINMETLTLTPMDSYRACSIIEQFCEDVPSPREKVEAWAYLIKTGDCWRLQGFYGRFASQLIENGIIASDGEILTDLDNY